MAARSRSYAGARRAGNGSPPKEREPSQCRTISISPGATPSTSRRPSWSASSSSSGPRLRRRPLRRVRRRSGQHPGRVRSLQLLFPWPGPARHIRNRQTNGLQWLQVLLFWMVSTFTTRRATACRIITIAPLAFRTTAIGAAAAPIPIRVCCRTIGFCFVAYCKRQNARKKGWYCKALQG